MSARFDPRLHEYEERARPAGMIYLLMIVVACAFGGFVWQIYSAPEVPTIPAPAGPYKIEAPAEDAEARSQSALDAVLEGRAESPASASPRPGPEAVAEPAPRMETAAAAAPRFVANGPYLAQLAALQSEAGVDLAWSRLASRAPDLFANARMDVERADLGQRGTYHRVRAGYFADRDNASRFCERIRRMGQDCIVVAR